MTLWGPERSIEIRANQDSIILGSKLIPEESISFYSQDGSALSPGYSIIQDSINTLILNDPHPALTIKYSEIDLEIYQLFQRKDQSMILSSLTSTPTDEDLYISSTKQEFKPLSGLYSQGSISRGIRVGNNQDAVLNSSLNLQLQGNLGNNTQIRASITDNNIPIQGDGYTQQLSEFDRVYIELENSDFGLLRAGDFNITDKKNYFLNFDKRISGAGVYSRVNNIPFGIQAGIARGKFSRNRFNGQEGNQGPYKLKGNNGELFVIIISGSERVYIDGVLLTRGQQNDYVIDYNAAEISFTALQPITKERRIVVEFQYTELNYLRSVAHTHLAVEETNWSTSISYYTEQDSKTQSISQNLSEEDKELLAKAGDNISQAVVSTIEPSSFSDQAVLYELIDSLGMDSVLVYSIDSTKQLYQASFSFLGSNAGNYIQEQSSANGRVFQWVAPIAGIPQGDYEPIRQLIAPERLQVLSSETNVHINDNNELSVKLALSNRDNNRFSSLDKENDDGLAAKVDYNFSKPLEKGKLDIALSGEYNNETFETVERIRDLEFARNWNLPIDYNGEIGLAGAQATYSKNQSSLNYRAELLSINQLSALRNEVNYLFKSEKSLLRFQGSWLESRDSIKETRFIRERLNARRYISKNTWVGVRSEGEWNRTINDSLLNNSYNFIQYDFFTGFGDTNSSYVEFNYLERFDDTARLGDFANFSKVQAVGAKSRWKNNFGGLLNLSIFSRSLKVFLPTEKELERTINSRINYTQKFFKNAIISTSFYESSSGTEALRNFSYIEVPTGTGNYMHTDYNDNGIKELDEFEIAPSPELGLYIRVFLPSNTFIRASLNKFGQNLSINAPQSWKSKSPFTKSLARFSNLSSFQIDKKTLLEGNTNSLNPFGSDISDSSIINLNQNFRSTLFFNRSSQKFGLDYTYRNSDNRNLLSFGIERNIVLENSFKLRFQLFKILNLRSSLSYFERENKSDNFQSRNYTLDDIQSENSISIQPNDKIVITAIYIKANKQGSSDSQSSLNSDDFGIQTDYKLGQKFSALVKLNYVINDFEGDANSPLGFEMLQALRPGENTLWNIGLQQTIRKNIVLTLSYTGRISEDSPAIQLGNVQIKAYF